MALGGKGTQQARARKFELVYLALGEGRSIARVFEIARSSGEKIHVKTLETYSSLYGWVEHAKEWDAERVEIVSGIVLEHAVADTVRHAEFGRTMQQFAAQAMSNRMKDPDDLDLTGSEIARLGAEGIKIERMASGLATERIEVMSSAMRVVIEDIGPLVRRAFERLGAAIDTHARPIDESLANMLHSIAEETLAEFGADADRIVDATFRAQGLLLDEASVPADTDDEEER
jgi:hypothetical protein